MERILELFLAIKKDPERYLPEKSVFDLREFLTGYVGRVSREGIQTRSGWFREGFSRWLGERFGDNDRVFSPYRVVASYSNGSADALDRYIELFHEFADSVAGVEETCSADALPPSVERLGLCELLRWVRKRPALYLIYPHFSGLHALISGYRYGGIDLGLAETEKFSSRNPRPWFRLINLHSFHDGGSSDGGAYHLFFSLLDEFATKIGRPGLFDVES
jgi:hypothetical protein